MANAIFPFANLSALYVCFRFYPSFENTVKIAKIAEREGFVPWYRDAVAKNLPPLSFNCVV
jgi:hypothetical protein